MYLRFGNNQSNTWEIIPSQNGNRLVAIYRGRITHPTDVIEDIQISERAYRLWKMFSMGEKAIDHMPDALPLLHYMYSQGFEIHSKIRDSKYTFTRLPE